jgi:flagellum-specific ATP synthase
MEIDEAIRLYPSIISFLKQETNEKISILESIGQLKGLAGKGE